VNDEALGSLQRAAEGQTVAPTSPTTDAPPAHLGSFRKNATAAGAPNNPGASQDRRFGDRSEVSETDIEWDSRREWP